MQNQISTAEPLLKSPIVITRGVHVNETISFITAKLLFDRMKEQGCNVILETQDQRDSPTYKVRMNRLHNMGFKIDEKKFQKEAQTNIFWARKIEDKYTINYERPYVFDMHTSDEKIFGPTSINLSDWKLEFSVDNNSVPFKGQIASFRGWVWPVAENHFAIEIPGPVKTDKNGNKLTYWDLKDIEEYKRKKINRDLLIYDNKLAWEKGYFSKVVLDKIIRLIHTIIETEGKENLFLE